MSQVIYKTNKRIVDRQIKSRGDMFRAGLSCLFLAVRYRGFSLRIAGLCRGKRRVVAGVITNHSKEDESVS